MTLTPASIRLTAITTFAMLTLQPLALPEFVRAQPAEAPVAINQAPVAHAATRVQAGIPQSTLDELDTAWDDARKAKAAYDEAMEAGDPRLMNQRWETVKTKYSDLYRAEDQVDTSRVQTLSQASGRSAAEIRILRESGQTWRAIAQKLGVPASALGLGHGRGDPVELAAQKAQRDKELDQRLKKDKDGDYPNDKNKKKHTSKGNAGGHWGV